MPVFAVGELILQGLLVLGIITAAWVVGHEIEKDVEAIGGNVITPAAGLAGSLSKNLVFLAAALIGIWLIARR